MTEAESFKIVIRVEKRPDGGLRVWSDDVPGLVLSNKDPERVIADIKPALEAILSEVFGCVVEAFPLNRMTPLVRSSERRPCADVKRTVPARRKTLEYAALACA